MLFAPIPVNALNNFTLPVNPVVVGIVLFSPLLLLIGAGVLQRAGAAVAIAVTLGTLQAALWWFSPWAAKVYATSVGLPLRDALIPSPPRFPGGAPMFLIAAAVPFEVLCGLPRHRALDARDIIA